MTLITANGRAILLSGRALRAVPGALPDLPDAPEVPGTTTALTLQDFVTYNAAGINIVQRTAGSENDATMAGGYADIEVESTFAGDAPYVEARVVDSANQATVVKDWTQITSRTVSGSTVRGILLRVPAGGPYLLQIRDKNNTALQSNGTTKWGVGVVMIDWGQSNMLGTLATGTSSDIVPGTGTTEWNYIRGTDVITSIFDTNGWQQPESFASVGRFVQLRMVAKALEAKHGKKIPVGLCLWAISQQSIDSFLPGGTASNRAMFTNSGTAAGSRGFSSPFRVWSGDAEFMPGHQGEANNGDLPNVYRDKEIQLVDMMVGAFAARGRTHQTFAFLPAVLGVFSGGGLNYVEYLRAAVLAFEQHAQTNGWRSRVGWTTLDCKGPPENTLHFQGDDKQRSLKRMIQGVLCTIDPVRAKYHSGGPRLAGTATRSGDTITLPVVGGETLEALNTGAAVTGWSAHTDPDFDDTKGSDVALTNVRPGAGVVLVDAVGAPSTFYVKHCGDKVGTLDSANSDVSNLLYRKAPYPYFDNGSGGNIFSGTDVRTDMPLFPTPTAIKVG